MASGENSLRCRRFFRNGLCKVGDTRELTHSESGYCDFGARSEDDRIFVSFLSAFAVEEDAFVVDQSGLHVHAIQRQALTFWRNLLIAILLST